MDLCEVLVSGLPSKGRLCNAGCRLSWLIEADLEPSFLFVLIPFQKNSWKTPHLSLTGCLAFNSNGYTLGILCLQREGEDSPARLRHQTFETALYTLIPQLVVCYICATALAQK